MVGFTSLSIFYTSKHINSHKTNHAMKHSIQRNKTQNSTLPIEQRKHIKIKSFNYTIKQKINPFNLLNNYSEANDTMNYRRQCFPYVSLFMLAHEVFSFPTSHTEVYLFSTVVNYHELHKYITSLENL
jgi:hypothetical protein